jgi:hypothetical protein
MDKQLKSLKKDLDHLLLQEVTVRDDEKKKIFQGIHVKKKQKSPIGYYATLVAAATLLCIFTLSQIDLFSKKDPGMSDDDPAIIVPDEPLEEDTSPVQEENPVREEPAAYTESPLFYETEDGKFKLKLTKDADRGIGLGDSMEEVLEIFGVPDERLFDDANKENPSFHYSTDEIEVFSIKFTEGSDPKVDYVNAFLYSNPVSEPSFYSGTYDYILDLGANINIYDDEEIVIYAKNNHQFPFYTIRFLNAENQQDGPALKVKYNGERITFEEFLEKIK